MSSDQSNEKGLKLKFNTNINSTLCEFYYFIGRLISDETKCGFFWTLFLIQNVKCHKKVKFLTNIEFEIEVIRDFGEKKQFRQSFENFLFASCIDKRYSYYYLIFSFFYYFF
jgi:hypothetical protein